jgi:hypothetical protein
MKLKYLKTVIAEELVKLSGKKLMTEQSGSGCVINQQAENAVVNTLIAQPQLGDLGITQNFINNMQGKPTQFYQARANTLADKIIELAKLHTCPEQRPPYNLLVCKGYNPMWQAALINKKKYVQLCSQNPGSC